MQMNPYLTFDGQCEAAFKFYAKVLGGKVEALMRFKGTPAEEHVPAGWAKKVLHSQLVAGKNVLMGSDAPPGRYEKMKGISVTLVFDDLKEGKRVFKALAKNGKVPNGVGVGGSSGSGPATGSFRYVFTSPVDQLKIRSSDPGSEPSAAIGSTPPASTTRY